MQFRFELIAFVVLLSLVIVATYQVYWLTNFYQEQYAKLEVSVNNAMNFADLNELGMRTKDIQWEQYLAIKEMIKTQGTQTDSVYTLSKGEAFMELVEDSADIPDNFQMEVPDLIVRITNKGKDVNMWNDASIMNSDIHKGFHRVIDSIQPVNFNRFDSLLYAELLRLDVRSPYIIQYVDCRNDSTLRILPAGVTIPDTTRYEVFSLSISETNDFAYQLYLENPRLYILKEMSELVIVSVLLITLLIVSYVYLLQIILRQKTLDQLKSDFTNNMTHELKTPVSVAYAAIDALQHFGMANDPAKRDEYLTITKDQLNNLNSLVEQILTMSMEERKNLKLVTEEIALQPLFVSIEQKFTLHVSKPVTFHIDVEPTGLSVCADKIHFRNILDNLVENAIKYSEKTVCITLSAVCREGKTVISVEDNGIGVPTSSIPRLFDKFYRVPTGNIQDVRGYGLGLHYVKTIVDKHHWKITVTSMVGKGSTFTIIIE